MSDIFKDRTAVITGAASGIGKALAAAAASRGMALALADNNAEALASYSRELSKTNSVTSAVIDVRRRGELEDFAASLKYSSIALVFANAGVMRAGTSWQLSEEDWSLVFDVNVKGVMNTASAFLPLLLEQTQPSRLVITGSTSAFMAREDLACYSSSKHALWGIAEAMALELQQISAQVGVSFLAPSGVKTPLASQPLTGAGAQSQKIIGELLNVYGAPSEEIAEQTFSALEANRFWIFPQPDFKPAMLKRIQDVAEERNPGQ